MNSSLNGLTLHTSLTLAPGTYWLPDGLTIAADDVVLEGNGAVLIGGGGGAGIRINGRSHLTLRHLTLQNFHHAITATNCTHLTLSHVTSRATGEVTANSSFLDIWRPAENPYGGGIFLHRVHDTTIEQCDLQHQMNGLLAYGCQRLTVRHSNASYCSGAGFYLSQTSDSLFEQNVADYCCRYHPRGDQWGQGHLGADAAGFVIVRRSCRNVFRRNLARLGGDGFFLAGLTPQREHLGCDDNLFEENDGSYSPNIAFEATFSRGNVYRNNKANHCNYGFWLGFSAECTLLDNQLFHNRRAGIAVENGYGMTVRGNDFRRNSHGVLLWSKYVASFAQAVPANDTSRNWLIEANRFWRNDKGIRIAANQDHGIRPMPADTPVPPTPHSHTLHANDLRDNRVGIELEGVKEGEETAVATNTFHNNLEANLCTL